MKTAEKQLHPLNPVLIVDDEPQIAEMVALTLKEAGISNYRIETDSRKVMELIPQLNPSLVMLDMMMPPPNGRELLAKIHDQYPEVPVVVVTALYEVETAVECMRNGARDYLVKPVEATRLIACVNSVISIGALQHEVSNLKRHLVDDALDNPDAFEEIKSCSKKMRGLFQYAEVVSRSMQPVLITGETGVGKELLARALHTLSGQTGDFVSINVAGLDENLFTDTLFGHKKGAFTGATEGRSGLVTRAANGTLFLDEIGDLGEGSQLKLLRLLQEREYYQVGSDTVHKCSARVLLATNRNLVQQIEKGRFRRDLYYRLCTHLIEIPPLRERTEDIPLLVKFFIQEAAESYGKTPPSPTVELLSRLMQYEFLGNVRELRGMIFDAVARMKGNLLALEHFSTIRDDLQHTPEVIEKPVSGGKNSLSSMFGHIPTFREIEDYLIDEALRIANGNYTIAAAQLGITRQTINNRLKSRGA
jgi:two-component system, NtrC family, response regulator HydG